MLIIFGLFLLFLLGYFIILSISKDNSWEERISLSFAFGLGFLTLLMFYLSRLNIRLTWESISLSVLGILVLLKLLFIRQKLIFKWPKIQVKDLVIIALFLLGLSLLFFFFNKIRVSLWHQVFIVPASAVGFTVLGLIWAKKEKLAHYLIITLLAFCFLGVLAMGIYWPIHEWDSLAMYDFLGKLFYWRASVSFPADLPNLDYYISYPFLTPIAHTFVYLFGGPNPKFIYPLFYGSLLLIFFSFLKKETTTLIALFFTLLLGTTYMVIEYGTSSYTNLPFAFYQTVGALFLYRFLKAGRFSDLLISGVSLGFSAWTRAAAEPFFIACLLVLLFFSGKRLVYSLFFFLTYLVIGYPWQIYIKETFDTRLYDAGWVVKIAAYALRHSPQNLVNFTALGEIFKQLLKILMDFKFYGAGGLLFVLFILFNWKSLFKEKILFSLIILNILFWAGFIFGHGVTISFSPIWQIILRDSMTRVFLGIYPLLLFFVAKTDLISEAFLRIKKIFPKGRRKSLR